LTTGPDGARQMIDLLKNPSGQAPRYYQIVLRVKFKGGVPTETSYVAHRELRAEMQTK
jgi:hypothetical protein